jgi:[NiFe] hydrogenase diaphorase moiety large subunit
MVLTNFNYDIDIADIVGHYGTERHYLMDIVREAQSRFGCVSGEAMDAIAKAMGIHRVEVEGVVSFYHFLSRVPKGKTTIYISKGALPSASGVCEVASAFEEEIGRKAGESKPSDPIGLEWTSCIGMNDQEPAALIDGVVFTKLTPDKARKIAAGLKGGKHANQLVDKLGDGNNGTDSIHSMVNNNIRRKGEVIFGERKTGDSISKLATMSRQEVLDEVKKSNLRGRGGAGFPTGLKWDFCLKNEADTRYVACNADEGEPGTFKDRVLLTERAELIFEGMAVAGYALGANEGILYLRGEYEYLRKHLEQVLNNLRNEHLLGNRILGKDDFNFDISIKMGAGAYICGEETSLIESAEGKRGDPRDRPPFPVSRGYMDKPTAVNNVETLCSAARVIEKGADWFKAFGTEKSAGTKVLSVSGDCKNPGVYEFPFGITLSEFLKEVGAENTYALQVGGPSGSCIPSKDFGRKIAFEDLATGGSMIVISQGRDLLRIMHYFLEFFTSESCGRCTPCRVGTKLMLNRFIKIREGRGTKSDLDYMKSLGRTITVMSRCGLGLTASNPVLTTLQNFPELYEKLLTQDEFTSEHDMEKAIQIGRDAAK